MQENNQVSIPVFILMEQRKPYGALANMSNGGDEAKLLVETSIEGTGDDYGYPCDIEGGMEVVEAIDSLNDSCQLRDLLMVFYTAGLRAGLKHKEKLERGSAEVPTNADIDPMELWEELDRESDYPSPPEGGYRVREELENADDEPSRRTHN